jgi:hypothetical protein
MGYVLVLVSGFLLDYFAGCSGSKYPFEAAGNPLSFVIQTGLFIEMQEIAITSDNVESDAVLKLSQANRAQVQRARIAFL